MQCIITSKQVVDKPNTTNTHYSIIKDETCNIPNHHHHIISIPDTCLRASRSLVCFLLLSLCSLRSTLLMNANSVSMDISQGIQCMQVLIKSKALKKGKPPSVFLPLLFNLLFLLVWMENSSAILFWPTFFKIIKSYKILTKKIWKYHKNHPHLNQSKRKGGGLIDRYKRNITAANVGDVNSSNIVLYLLFLLCIIPLLFSYF